MLSLRPSRNETRGGKASHLAEIVDVFDEVV